MTDESLAELLSLTREVDSRGTITYRNAQGFRHRIHGPAVIKLDGSEFWFRAGNLHRDDGPALTDPGGSPGWYLSGFRYSESEWRLRTTSRTIDTDL